MPRLCVARQQLPSQPSRSERAIKLQSETAATREEKVLCPSFGGAADDDDEELEKEKRAVLYSLQIKSVHRI